MRALRQRRGTRVGIVGLGGLGVMGLKLAEALGCEVTAVSRSASKKDFAIGTCGADAFIASSDADAMRAARGNRPPRVIKHVDSSGALELLLRAILVVLPHRDTTFLIWQAR